MITVLKALVNIVLDRWLTCIIMFKWMNNGQDTKNNKNHAFTMKLSMNFLFFVVYDNNYSTVVYEGNIIRFPLF